MPADGSSLRAALVRFAGSATEEWAHELTEQVRQDAPPTYEWEVGRPGAPFHPHQRLARIKVTSKRNAVLNFPTWPANGGPLEPGDHQGCQCAFTATGTLKSRVTHTPPTRTGVGSRFQVIVPKVRTADDGGAYDKTVVYDDGKWFERSVRANGAKALTVAARRAKF